MRNPVTPNLWHLLIFFVAEVFWLWQQPPSSVVLSSWAYTHLPLHSIKLKIHFFDIASFGVHLLLSLVVLSVAWWALDCTPPHSKYGNSLSQALRPIKFQTVTVWGGRGCGRSVYSLYLCVRVSFGSPGSLGGRVLVVVIIVAHVVYLLLFFVIIFIVLAHRLLQHYNTSPPFLTLINRLIFTALECPEIILDVCTQEDYTHVHVVAENTS